MKTIKIGSQVWTKKNLRVFKFRNGDPIPIVQDRQEWCMSRSSAMCINPNNGECYYNWYAVIDPRGLAPEGFHVPSDEEWDELVNHLGGNKTAGLHLKSKKTRNGSNASGFSGLPAGHRGYSGYFNGLGNYGHWWSSSTDEGYGITRLLDSGYSNVYRFDNDFPYYGFSVRLIKD
jgi:uncharacterized protein (TIGR02145 family)